MKKLTKIITKGIITSLLLGVGATLFLLGQHILGVTLIVSGLTFIIVTGIMFAVKLNKGIDNRLSWRERRNVKRSKKKQRKTFKLGKWKQEMESEILKEKLAIAMPAMLEEQVNEWISKNYTRNIFINIREKEDLFYAKFKKKQNKINKTKKVKKPKTKITIK